MNKTISEVTKMDKIILDEYGEQIEELEKAIKRLDKAVFKTHELQVAISELKSLEEEPDILIGLNRTQEIYDTLDNTAADIRANISEIKIYLTIVRHNIIVDEEGHEGEISITVDNHGLIDGDQSKFGGLEFLKAEKFAAAAKINKKLERYKEKLGAITRKKS